MKRAIERSKIREEKQYVRVELEDSEQELKARAGNTSRESLSARAESDC